MTKSIAELLSRDMEQFRLNQKISPLLTQEREKLSEEGWLVWHFVHHIEGQNEINRLGNIEARFVALHQSNPRREIRSFNLSGKFVEHPLLEVCCDNSPVGPNQTSKFNGEKPGTTTYIQSGPSFCHEGGKNLAWILKPPPDPAIKSVSELDRAYAISFRRH